jgi:phage terminase Nu1 subunit (DNA packaging protein)
MKVAKTPAKPDDLAALLGVSVQTIRDLARRGIIVRTGRTFALEEAIPSYCAHLRKLATGRGGEQTINSAATDRGRLAKAQADSVEIKNARLRGELVDAHEVDIRWASMVRAARSGVMAMPSRISQRLPHLSAHDIVVMEAELRAALTEMGNADPP